jgi:hypothetical protein
MFSAVGSSVILENKDFYSLILIKPVFFAPSSFEFLQIKSSLALPKDYIEFDVYKEVFILFKSKKVIFEKGVE